jgi:hypothetical protein
VSSEELVPMPFSQLDPSVTLAFYVRDEVPLQCVYCNCVTGKHPQIEFDRFVQSARHDIASDSDNRLFSIEHQPPSYDGLHHPLFTAEDDGRSANDEEDEYVFV